MKVYFYKAVDKDGKKVKGKISAESYADFKQALNNMGLFCIEYSIQTDIAKESKAAFRIPLKELSIVCRQFAAMLNAGLGVVKSLDVLCDQTENVKVRGVLYAVMEDVQKGFALHIAMNNQTGAFPFYLISSVESGEESGTLDDVMQRMSDYFEKQYKTRKKISGALTYPIILAVLCVSVVILLLVFVVPKFLTMFERNVGDLPLPTQVLLAISNFFVTQWYVVLIVVAAIAIGITIIKRVPVTRLAWDTMILRIPIIGKSKRILLTARFAHTLATLTASGISLLTALEVAARVINNAYITKCVGLISEDLKKGVTLSESIKKFDVFPPMFVSMIAIGEESGEMDALLQKTATYYDSEADRAVTKLVTMIEPLMIIFMALVIGFIVISVILPIYSMYQNIL
ncbi:MAG: type II secretion system F family protein [Christensenellaceae bacterium]